MVFVSLFFSLICEIKWILGVEEFNACLLQLLRYVECFLRPTCSFTMSYSQYLWHSKAYCWRLSGGNMLFALGSVSVALNWSKLAELCFLKVLLFILSLAITILLFSRFFALGCNYLDTQKGTVTLICSAMLNFLIRHILRLLQQYSISVTQCTICHLSIVVSYLCIPNTRSQQKMC